MRETPAIDALLRQLRESNGTSLRGAAGDIGVAPSYLSRIERGERTLGDDLRRKMADYYEIDEGVLELASGRVPSDIVEILQAHPDLIAQLRREYGGNASADPAI